MKISDNDFLSALLRQEFLIFLQFAFREVGGGRAYKHNWHIDAVAYQLERLRLGENRRLITTMPPRHLKSVTITTAWVAWMLGKDPSLRFICASYGLDLSLKHARDCLRIMSTDWYRRAFPQTRLVKRTVDDFETSAGGGRLSTSIGGVVTGRGADIIIIDDPMKADDALSETRRKDVLDWHDTALMSRLDNQAKGIIILVMQRLHEADLAGELIRRGGWEELRLSAIATEDEKVAISRDAFHFRAEGSALHPETLSAEMCVQKRADEPYVFAAHYQQDPVSRIGAFVQKDWFTTYDDPPVTGTVVQSWDTAIKTSVRSDWSVGITARYYQGRFYILDVFRKKVEFGELTRSVCASCRAYGVSRLLIEDAASGQQLIQVLREDSPTGVAPPLAVKSTVDKLARFEAIASRIEAGTVVLPRSAPWLADFVAELVGFPGALHDDQADALAQMLANPPSSGVIANAGPIAMDPDGSFDDDDWYDGGSDPWGA